MRLRLATLAWRLGLFLLLALPLRAATFVEDFSTDPAARGWQTYGEASLFQWNAAAQWLEVTWDSARTNSYFRHSLGTILGKQDSLVLRFDLLLRDAAIGTNPGKPYPFEVALGFQNSLSATNCSFQRGHGFRAAQNLVEFDYFPEFSDPDAPISATIWPGIIATNGDFNYDSGSAYVEVALPTNTWMRVEMRLESTNLTTTILTNGQPFTAASPGAQLARLTTHLLAKFTDFRTDLFAVSSYSDAGGTGSLLAHGIVDNITWTVPDPPIASLQADPLLRFSSRSNWIYALESSADLRTWQPASLPVPGNQGWLQFSATSAPAPAIFYRVKAERP